MRPKRGMRFEHNRILSDDLKNPAICTVTKVGGDNSSSYWVYYRVGDATKTTEYYTQDRESKVVRKWL